MQLLLVRHEESAKDLRGQFSSRTDNEDLTAIGRRRAMVLGRAVCAWASHRGLEAKRIYSADSGRATGTAQHIANAFGVPVETMAELRSTWPGAFAGKTEAEVRRLSPVYYDQLTLYRAGLFNAYDFDVPPGKEDKRQFEQRIAKAVDEVVSMPGESLKVVVTHRSPITATLMRFARSCYQYPEGFFGYVDLGPGSVSWLERDGEGTWRIRDVNREATTLA